MPQSNAVTARRGRPFQKGHDPRRHKFTTGECQRRFWAAIDSIVSRYSEAGGKVKDPDEARERLLREQDATLPDNVVDLTLWRQSHLRPIR